MSAFAEEIVAALVRSSLQGAVFIGLVWMVCRLFPRLPASIRCGLWWAACLKLLIGLVWISPVELPLLPAGRASEALTTPALLSQGERREENSIANFEPSPPGRGQGEGSGETALAVLWLAGLLALCVKAARQLRHTRWVIRRSEPLDDGWIRTAFADLCARLGLRRAPGLLGSEDVRTPQAMGLVRPLVVLPRAGLDKLSPPEVSMTLCHELLHLRRGDLWWGWVPALAHRIFFFHPLAAMAAREYAIAREAACDAEVIQILGSAPQAYGRLLLRWGVAPRETGLAAAGASPSLQNLKRRLQMLQQSTANNRDNKKRRFSGWWWLAGVILLAGLVPLRIVAQEPAPEPPEVPEAMAAPEAAEAPEAPEVAEATEMEAPEAAEAPEAPEAAEPAEAPEAPPAPPAMAGGVAGGVGPAGRGDAHAPADGGPGHRASSAHPVGGADSAPRQGSQGLARRGCDAPAGSCPAGRRPSPPAAAPRLRREEHDSAARASGPAGSSEAAGSPQGEGLVFVQLFER